MVSCFIVPEDNESEPVGEFFGGKSIAGRVTLTRFAESIGNVITGPVGNVRNYKSSCDLSSLPPSRCRRKFNNKTFIIVDTGELTWPGIIFIREWTCRSCRRPNSHATLTVTSVIRFEIGPTTSTRVL